VPPRLDDRYELTTDLLGSGNFGEVWRAEDTHQDQTVAIKLFRDHVALDAVLLEARAQTRLQPLLAHPHVLPLLNVVLKPPRPFIVMPYMPRGSVEAKLTGGNTNLVEAVRWARDALDGLAYVHGLGVLHRDVKPNNLLLDEHDRVRLSDFGIAEDTLKGSAGQMAYGAHQAPEFYLNGTTSAATDIWAMGCTLYRLITDNQYPFGSPLRVDDMLQGKFTPAQQVNPQVPLRLSSVVKTALSVDPGDRFRSALEMVGALSGCRIANGWSHEIDEGGRQLWRSAVSKGTYLMELAGHGGRQELSVCLRPRDGKAQRCVYRRKFTRPSDTKKELRRLLLVVVDGGYI